MKPAIYLAAALMLLSAPAFADDGDIADCRMHIQYFKLPVHSLSEMDKSGGPQAIVYETKGDLGNLAGDAECQAACEKNIGKNRPTLDARYQDEFANDKVHNAFGDRLESIRMFCTNGAEKPAVLFDRFEDLK